MTASASESVFDVAEWFLDTALNDGEYLQPMKMQYLMFLAQGYYAALTKGQRLIPSVFIATARSDFKRLRPDASLMLLAFSSHMS